MKDWDKLSKKQKKPYKDFADILSGGMYPLKRLPTMVYEFANGLDNEQIFKIKPLEWIDIGNGIFDSSNIEGYNYRVYAAKHANGVKEYLWFWKNEPLGKYDYPCNSIEHGKQLCQEHYKEQLMKHLIKA